MPSPVSLGAARASVLAFDVGGSFIKAALIDTNGNVQGSRSVATPLHPTQPAETILDRIGELARELQAEHPQVEVHAAGLTVPGIVDAATGTGIYSANLGWRDFPFTTQAQSRLGMPVAFGHDVAAAGAAELQMRQTHDHHDAAVLIIGTGIAAAVFSGDKPVTAGGYAGEIGHALVPAPSGGTTILEALGSAGAITHRYTAISGNTVDGAKAVLSLAAEGDPIARQVWEQAVDALAFSISQCVSILGTEVFVIGGGLSQAGEALLVPLRKAVYELLTFHRRPRILPATLGQDAGLIGAALYARAILVTGSS
ncbi:ROK family protein [Paenarthrobacter sp. 2TAF44]|uniref:ROK family protein n=1 Tax=Paenarthrobacter sp. 2TAF44 TaxID=3233018 RepID=UPI003F95413C